MEDALIIKLYQARSEDAIKATDQKYKSYCQKIAYRILENKEDAEEVVADTWIKAWEHIPPDEPRSLAAYLGTITRRLSLNVIEKRNAKKRGKTEIDLIFHELELMLTESESPETACEEKELSELINRFLETLSERDRNILLCRYYLVYPIKEIAKRNRLTANHVSSILTRTLEKLKLFLVKENYLS